MCFAYILKAFHIISSNIIAPSYLEYIQIQSSGNSSQPLIKANKPKH